MEIKTQVDIDDKNKINNNDKRQVNNDDKTHCSQVQEIFKSFNKVIRED